MGGIKGDTRGLDKGSYRVNSLRGVTYGLGFRVLTPERGLYRGLII